VFIVNVSRQKRCKQERKRGSMLPHYNTPTSQRAPTTGEMMRRIDVTHSTETIASGRAVASETSGKRTDSPGLTHSKSESRLWAYSDAQSEHDCSPERRGEYQDTRSPSYGDCSALSQASVVSTGRKETEDDSRMMDSAEPGMMVTRILVGLRSTMISDHTASETAVQVP
jgi:hypothetical protein